MKEFKIRALMISVALICATIMGVNGVEGYGWLIFLAFLMGMSDS
jgi:hypothetical protein